MKDAKGHGSDGRFQTSTGISAAAKERVAMRAMVDLRQFESGRTSNRNMPANTTPHQIGGSGPARFDVPHLRGVMNATANKTLAQVSAMGATTATIKTGGN